MLCATHNMDMLAVERVPLHGFGQPAVTHHICQACQDDERSLSLLRYRQEQAGLPFRYRKATLDSIITETPAQAEILEGGRSFFQSKGTTPSSLIFIGTLGSGKTHLGCAIGNEFLRAGRSVFYSTALGVIRKLRSTWHSKSESEEAVFRKLVKTDLLILDELGVQAGSASELAMVTNLLDGRYAARKPTILIGNLTVAELTSTLGERIIDRFKQGGRVLVFDWPSRRPAFPDEEEGPEPPVYRPAIT